MFYSEISLICFQPFLKLKQKVKEKLEMFTCVAINCAL